MATYPTVRESQIYSTLTLILVSLFSSPFSGVFFSALFRDGRSEGLSMHKRKVKGPAILGHLRRWERAFKSRTPVQQC